MDVVGNVTCNLHIVQSDLMSPLLFFRSSVCPWDVSDSVYHFNVIANLYAGYRQG